MAKRHILSQIHNCGNLIKQPIVEITGQNRVLIENHQGILAYSREEIGIKVSYGKVVITGSDLNLLQISCEQLVVKGHIVSLQLCGR